MQNKLLNQSFLCLLSVGFIFFTTILIPIFPTTASAFQFEQGEIQGSLDTTLSYGTRYRLDDPDQSIIGLTNGGQAYSVNGDNGNLNFDKGFVSNTVKITSDLELNYKNFGAFVRGTGFYDYEIVSRDQPKIRLTDDARDLVGKDAKVLDAFISGSFEIAERPLEIRVGDQVVSWGEGTFFLNGINAINPIDVGAIRLPGAELREALVPEGMIYASMGITDDISFEGLYLYDWDNTDIDPPGSYFATTDVAGEGGKKVMLAFGKISDEGTDLGPLGFDPDFLAVPRGPTEDPDHQGQFGFAFRYFSEPLNDTEFGFYDLNYHSRVPILSARTGTEAGVAGSSSAAFGATRDQLVGMGMDMATATSTAAGLCVNNYSKTGEYYTEYPEDIQMFGISFNTDLGNSGIAIQGEVSYHKDAPLQIDDVELVLAYLSPIGFNPAYKDNQISLSRNKEYGANEIIKGYIEKDVTQAQMTATKVFGPIFGANVLVMLCEVGVTHVDNMPDKDELRLEAAGTYTTGNPTQAYLPTDDPATKPFGGAHYGQAAEPSIHFADADSWGYRLFAKLVYNNAFGPVNFSPRIAFAHDVAGNSPGPGGNFIEDRKAITLGATWDYLSEWSFDFSYTNFYGADRYNLINDRDFYQANIKYSF